MTCYVQVCHDACAFEPDNWKPWSNCASPQEAAVMACHRFARDAGYASPRGAARLPGGDKPLEIMVYVATDKTPRHANGRFMACEGFKMKLSRTKE